MQNAPNKIEIGNTLNAAFFYWSKTIKYQLVFSLLYFSILLTLASFASNYYGISDKISSFAHLILNDQAAFTKKTQELALTENFGLFTMALIFIKATMYPLNIGLLQIYKKIDLGEIISINDIFVGYRGLNFFKFLGYGLFWGIIYSYTGIFFPLMLVWILLTMLVSPLMFFANTTIIESIKLNFKALQNNFVLLLVAAIVSILFSYCGFIMFGIGIVLTYPFWNAMIYVLYQTIFTEKK